jgi:hypothetical protein
LKLFKQVLCTVGAAMALAVFAAPASAGPIYTFGCITDNSAGDCAIGEAQLSMEVIDEGGGLVGFKFFNDVGEASSIADVYFDDDSLLGVSSITDSGVGVAFSDPANPPDLPGGGLSFTATSSFDSDSPIVANGVNSSTEWLEITFSLQSGGTYQDVIDALGTGDLRVGLHVQGFQSGGSEAFINNPNPVPEPGTLLLLGAGLTGMASARRRRSNR